MTKHTMDDKTGFYHRVESDRKVGRNTAEDDVCPVCHGFGDDEDTGITCQHCSGLGTRSAYDNRSIPSST